MKKLYYGLLALALVGGCSSSVVHSNVSSAAAVSDNSMKWAFTQAGQHPDKLLIEKINSTRNTLDIAVYSFTLDEIKDAVISAHKRGVKVRIISDKGESANKAQIKVLDSLAVDNGIPIKIKTSNGLMHEKLCIVDGKSVAFGSFNWTKSASTVNDEVLVTVDNQEMAQSWEQVFEASWNDKQNYGAFN